MKLKHKPNKQLWCVGAIVIHDLDHVSRNNLMVVVDIKKDVFITKYLFPEKLRSKNHKKLSANYGTFECDIRELHYPGRFPKMKIDYMNYIQELAPFVEKGKLIIEEYQKRKEK
jgi:hypothetical protein